MRREFPHVPAAFINAIAEEGTKAEAIEWLQRTWDELCAVKAEYQQLLNGVLPEGEDSSDRVFCLEDALRPFAQQADTMQVLNDSDKVCGIYVAHFRYAAKVLNESPPQPNARQKCTHCGSTDDICKFVGDNNLDNFRPAPCMSNVAPNARQESE